MLALSRRLKEIIIGHPLNPLSPHILRHVSLVAFLAWVGLGADGLSSSCYGPEEAYMALGSHTHFALYIAIATAITVFVISLGYNQVIELVISNRNNKNRYSGSNGNIKRKLRMDAEC